MILLCTTPLTLGKVEYLATFTAGGVVDVHHVTFFLSEMLHPPILRPPSMRESCPIIAPWVVISISLPTLVDRGVFNGHFEVFQLCL